MANGAGIDTILENAANNPENAEFSYKLADGSTHKTFPLTTENEAPAELQAEVDQNGGKASLASIAFHSVDSAPTVAAYEAAFKAGKPASADSIQQMRGFFLLQDNSLVLVKVEAVEAPAVLPYEQAREKALAKKTDDVPEITDDTGLVLYMEECLPEGQHVGICPGNPGNLKVTKPEDLRILLSILHTEEEASQSGDLC